VILIFWKRLCCFILVLMLTACGVHQKYSQQQTAKLAELSQEDFKDAMLWKKFNVAASLMLPEHRKKFINTFMPLKDIQILAINTLYLQPSDENRRFETTIEMEYYLLPSVTVKTFTFDQIWVYFEGDDPTQQGFLITTSFPDFP